MKNKFAWYFPLSESQKEAIWKSCFLTVDANVLLDLYRYHEDTRKSIVSSLNRFNGRLWLSNQAAEEFIRNRNSVIVETEKKFSEAENLVESLQKSLVKLISDLKSCRILPDEVSDDLSIKIKLQIDQTIEKIQAAKSNHPQYLKDDPILEEIDKMFGSSIGDGFIEKELAPLKAEAENRIKDKVPPGFLDQNKDGEKPYGDFFMWRQILQYSKDKKLPIIFVTSERKDDWWERYSGITTGQRPELLREAHEFCGQKILIYTTQNFVKYASNRSGESVDERVVEDIKAVDTRSSETEHAVDLIKQIKHIGSESLHNGEILLNLRRPVRNLTVSGSLKPRMSCIPSLSARLIDEPPDMPPYIIRAGAGTNHDFNLHVITNEPGGILPVGEYILYYEAICNKIQNSEITND